MPMSPSAKFWRLSGVKKSTIYLFRTESKIIYFSASSPPSRKFARPALKACSIPLKSAQLKAGYGVMEPSWSKPQRLFATFSRRIAKVFAGVVAIIESTLLCGSAFLICAFWVMEGRHFAIFFYLSSKISELIGGLHKHWLLFRCRCRWGFSLSFFMYLPSFNFCIVPFMFKLKTI